MKKVLLVYDDFNELVQTESQLKKVGLDIVGISNELSLSDQILSFNPDAVVAWGQSTRVSSFSVGKKISSSRSFHGKAVIIVPKGVRPKPEDMIKMKIDALVEAPVAIERLLQVLSKVLSIDLTGLIEKLQRAQAIDDSRGSHGGNEGRSAESASEFVRSQASAKAGPGHQTISSSGSQKKTTTEDASFPSQDPQFEDSERMAKYADFLAGEKPIDTKATTFNKDEVRQKMKELKKDWNFDELEDLDQLKREFASAMFRKK